MELILLGLWVGMIWWGCNIAEGKGRSRWWGLFPFFLGLIGLVIVAIVPPSEEEKLRRIAEMGRAYRGEI